MALTVNPVVQGVNAVYKLGNGLQLRVVEVTSSDVSVDYSAGFDIAAIATQCGLSAVFAVIAASIRASAGTHRVLLPSYDVVNQKLKLGENAAAAGAFDEVDPDTDIVDGDIIRITLLGAGV